MFLWSAKTFSQQPHVHDMFKTLEDHFAYNQLLLLHFRNKSTGKWTFFFSTMCHRKKKKLTLADWIVKISNINYLMSNLLNFKCSLSHHEPNSIA